MINEEWQQAERRTCDSYDRVLNLKYIVYEIVTIAGIS